jgi:hypothetical protein
VDFYVQNAKMGGTLFREDQKMSKVDFFTPIVFDVAFNSVISGSEILLDVVDSYFYLGGKQVCAVSGNIKDNGSTRAYRVQNPPQPSLFTTALKVASYFTLVLPLIMLVAKAVLRSMHHIEIVEEPTHSHSSKHKKRSYSLDPSRYSAPSRTSNTILRSAPVLPPSQPSVYVPPSDTTRKQTSERARPLEDPRVPVIVTRPTKTGNKEPVTRVTLGPLDTSKGSSAPTVIITRPSEKVVNAVMDKTTGDVRLIAPRSVQSGEGVVDATIDKITGKLMSITTVVIPQEQKAPSLTTPLEPREQKPAEFHKMNVIKDKTTGKFTLVEPQSVQSVVYAQPGPSTAAPASEKVEPPKNASASSPFIGLSASLYQPKPSAGVVLEKQEAPSLTTPLTRPELLAKFYERTGVALHAWQCIGGYNLDIPELDRGERGEVMTEDGKVEQITMGVVSDLVVWAINKAITKLQDARLTNRCILLNADGPLSRYRNLGGKQPWLRRIIEALVKEGHLFELMKDDAEGYLVQA